MSKLDRLGSFLKHTAKFAPIVLMVTPLAPIAGTVAAGIQEAEAMFGEKEGRQKLAHVTNLAVLAAEAKNAQAGSVVIDPALVRASATDVISAVVSTVKLVEETQKAA